VFGSGPRNITLNAWKYTISNMPTGYLANTRVTIPGPDYDAGSLSGLCAGTVLTQPEAGESPISAWPSALKAEITSKCTGFKGTFTPATSPEQICSASKVPIEQARAACVRFQGVDAGRPYHSCLTDYCGTNATASTMQDDLMSTTHPLTCSAGCFAAANPNVETGKGYYAYSKDCLGGGLGCVGNSGCKVCSVQGSGMYGDCPKCVLDHYSLSPPAPPPPSPVSTVATPCASTACGTVWNTPSANNAGTCGAQISWVRNTGFQGHATWAAACNFVGNQATTPECKPCAS